jgi:benzoyl-CoA-dihydrodiol lyase
MGTEVRETHVARFDTHPDRYRHWRLSFDGPVATLSLAIDEEGGLRPDDYGLKLNSYDLGVDIELMDAYDRIRYEHPEVRAVVVTSGLPRIFSAGANIRMLASSTHGFKVNFCRFTNETRCFIEDASETAGIRTIAALNGTASGGGYELALAADRILLVDDGSSAVSLPEVPLLGVLPGTGGLTRLVDKRKIRRDVADLFCTKAEGFRARDAVKYRLVDQSFPKSKWDDGVRTVAASLAASSPARSTQGIAWTPLEPAVSDDGTREYRYVRLSLDAAGRTATLLVRGPTSPAPTDAASLRAEGADTWSLRVFRELEDALFHLRFTYDTLGLVLLRTSGDRSAVLAHDAALDNLRGDWLADEIVAFQTRVLRRLDNTARSFFAVIDGGSCFVGSLFELTLAADRAYMLDDPDQEVAVCVTARSNGRHPMSTGLSRLAARFIGTPERVAASVTGEDLDAAEAFAKGLVTVAPDALDWEDEVRIAVEERVSLSPDALTGMEQNLRFVGAETCDTKIFGRLSAWQNWIFQRPNAVGEDGALTLYGHPERPKFDWKRT